DKLTFEIRQYEIANSVTVLGPGGISFSGTNLTVDAPNAGAEVRFLDIQGSSTARDLGLRFVPAADFDAVTQNGDAVNPRLTAATPISALAALTTPLDSIRLGLNAQSFDIDLSTATTIGDVAVAIEGAAEGLRVEIDSDTNGINVFNELSGTAQRALTITDVPSTNNSATALGIRSLNTATQISDFNFGDGVTVLSGNPDPTFNVDFEIVLPPVDTAPPGTPSTTIPIDLSPADMATVGTLLAAVNTQIDAALTTAGRPTTDLTAGLATGTSGLALIQDATITTPSSVDRRNNSTAADQLGFLNSTFDSTSNSLIAEDRSAVRVDSVFTHLLDLKEALETNDTLGIEVAARRLEVAIDDVTEQRAVIGGFDRRAQNEIRRAEDNAVVDAEVRSQIADLDFAEAAARFSQLQTQLEAGLRVTSLGSSLSLLDFLG
ncbi:MAG: flagellin, partial [Planctomycetota bacterium]